MLKKRGEHNRSGEQIQLGLGWTDLLLLSPDQASDSLWQLAAAQWPAAPGTRAGQADQLS